jgi:hypothetical protein
VYEQAWPALVAALADIDPGRNLSQPLLLDLDAHGYLSAPTRLLVVGQQTNGWTKKPWGSPLGPEPIGYLCAEYREFQVGKDYYASPFWAAAHQLHRELNPGSPDGAFIWSNVLKLDEGKGRPGADVEQRLLSHFDVVPAECRIAEPEVVVFFTGPEYDDVLRVAFPGLQFVPIPGVEERLLARLVHPGLPRRSFRTYHPKYLRLRDRWDVIARMVQLAREEA